MTRKQRTLKTVVEFAGVGLHSGQEVRGRMLPAPVGTGIEFVRTDLPDAPRIPHPFAATTVERVPLHTERLGACAASVRRYGNGPPLFLVHGETEDLDESSLFAALSLKLEPTLDEDVAYGFRLLVDIAERSLSESPFQDPTTAMQAIDRLHDILRQLARRPLPDGRVRDDDGEIRLLVKTMSWEDYVRLAFTEIRIAGAGSRTATSRSSTRTRRR